MKYIGFTESYPFGRPATITDESQPFDQPEAALTWAQWAFKRADRMNKPSFGVYETTDEGQETGRVWTLMGDQAVECVGDEEVAVWDLIYPHESSKGAFWKKVS